MSLRDPPPGWETDEISKFLDVARSNSYATFHNLRSEYQKLVDIDIAFRKAVDSLINTKDWFAAFFLLRAHSSFLGAVRLSISGQVSEGYACLRLTIENALYGLYISQNPGSRETWLRRHDSDAAKKRVREEFKIRSLFDALRSIDTYEAKVVETLYERTIDYGAHPNERALMQSMEINEGADRVDLKVIYLTGDTLSLRLALRTCAQVGVCCLGVFRLIYRQRFDLVGLSDTLTAIKKGL
jgi:hypothetical protein